MWVKYEEEKNTVSHETLRNWLTDVFIAAGLSVKDSGIVSSNIAEAELRGVRSHGLMLVPLYLKRIVCGGIRREYVVKIIKDCGSTVVIDGGGGPGQALAVFAVEKGIEKALSGGVAYVCLRNSNHVGMLATYSRVAAERGLMSVVMTNSGPSVATGDLKKPLMGNNALCFGAPSEAAPVIVDMATGVVACGKVRYAALHGETIPNGWIYDKNGNFSLVPQDMEQGGCVVPMGGYKGFCLAFIVDMLTAVIGGGIAGANAGSQRFALTEPTKACQSFIFINPDYFVGREGLLNGIREYVDTVRNFGMTIEGKQSIVPGEPENFKTREHQLNGIKITNEIRKVLSDAIVHLEGVSIERLFDR